MPVTGLSRIPSIDQLRVIESAATARDMFKANVGMVEIEVFSYCNRRCWFCPNATHDRISTNKYMDPKRYSDLLDQLASIEFAGMLTYSRYNEPFADRIILDRIREARVKLPLAKLHTNSNGDYLDGDYIAEIYDAGLRSLNIQFYLRNEERYDHEAVKARALQTAKRLGLQYSLTRDEPGVWFEYAFDYRDMAIRGYGRNFELNGTSRGDLVDIKRDYVRTAPCLMPFWSVYIDFNGKIMPCCNFRSDVPEHHPYVVGDLEQEPNLFLNYANRKASQFRRSLINLEPKEGLCRNCNFVLETPNDADAALMADLLHASAHC